MLRFIDDEVGRLLDHLRATGLAERTLVLFTSDHGDYMGEHGMMSKAHAFYDCLVRVPLLAWWPGRLPAGHRIPHLIEQIDVMPTILDLCGVPVSDGVQARSCAPLLLDPDGSRGDQSYVPREWVVAESGLEGKPTTMEEARRLQRAGAVWHWGGRPECYRGRAKMLRTCRWKYVHYVDGQRELYDLEADAWEAHNLAAEPTPEQQALMAHFRDQLVDWCIRTEDTLPHWPLHSGPAGRR